MFSYATASGQHFQGSIQQRSANNPLTKSKQNTYSRQNNTGLPDRLKAGIENLSGYNMDDVRVHYNSSRPAQLDAYAYTEGTEIHVAPGQEKHLPHEAWHVVQQMQGRVKPTHKERGVNINDDPSLEHAASVMGAKADGFSSVAQLSVKTTISQPCIQCLNRELKKVKNHAACKTFMSGDTTNPENNYNQIHTLINNIIGAEYCTYDNIEEIATSLKVPIPPKVRPTVSPADRSRFSAIPEEYEEDDIMLNKILRAPEPPPVKDIKTGKSYYHIRHDNPKPFWIIDENGLIEIIGIYRHIGKDNNHYKKASSGSGPTYITI